MCSANQKNNGRGVFVILAASSLKVQMQYAVMHTVVQHQSLYIAFDWVHFVPCVLWSSYSTDPRARCTG